jgi:hypothetical protein
MSRTTPAPPPPRLAPERPLPPYAYLPGRTPHPTRDPGGHSYGAPPETPAPPDPADWRACGDYLYGIDLFNRGYFWEAHEAWEGLWVACGRRGATAAYLQGLINLAAAGFKARWGNARGLRANAATARRLFLAAAGQLRSDGPRHARAPRHMGLDVRWLAEQAAALAREQPAAGAEGAGAAGSDEPPALAFDVILRPV